MSRRIAAGLLALALCACEGPPTQILVVVDAEPLVRSRARGLSVRIWGRSRDQGDFPAGVVHDATEAVAPFSWPRRYAIAPFERDASRLWRFEASGIDEGGAPFVVTRAISGYQAGESLQVVMVLHDSCIGVLCEDDLDSSCDPLTLDCESAMRDVGELDPLTDGGVYDAGPGQTCSSDPDCDDGLECTVDTCVAGVCSNADSDTLCDAPGCTTASCVAGECVVTPVDANCDDGIACTTDVCQMNGDCAAMPDNMACTASTGGMCDPVNGCQYDTCVEGVTCVPEGCNDAMCSGDTCLRPSRCGATEFCCAGTCAPIGCDDGNPCTADACGAMGCVNDPAPLETMLCDDGQPCTVGTVCTAGVCGGGLDCAAQAGECRVGTCTGMGCSFQTGPRDGMVCGPMMSCRNRCAAGVCEAQTCGTDAGMPDAGFDAGGLPDGGAPDAGFDGGFDAGGLPDAGFPDAGDACGGVCLLPEICCGTMCCDTTMNMCMGGFCVGMGFGDGAVSLDGGFTAN